MMAKKHVVRIMLMLNGLKADLFPSINFNNTEETKMSEIQKLDHFKNVLNDNDMLDNFRCPRNISATHGSLNIVIEINSKGFKVMEPTNVQLEDYSHLIQVFLAKYQWKTVAKDGKTFTNASTAVLDTTCEKKEQIASTLASYYSDHDLVMDSIAGHKLEQISAGLIKGTFELISISKMCGIPSIMNDTLKRYLRTTVGMENNPCEIKACTLDSGQFKRYCYQILALGALGLILLQFYLFFGRKTALGKWLKQNLPVLQFCWPGTIGRINLMMETYNNRRTNVRKESTSSDNTLQTSNLSSDSEFQSFRANMMIKNTAIKKIVRGDRKLILTIFLVTLFFLFMAVFSTADNVLQDNYCNLLENVRRKLL